MRIVKIPKRNGKFRIIYVPSFAEKANLRLMLGALEKKAAKSSPEGIVHGFLRRKSAVTNAIAHIGHEFTVTMDIENFFDSVKPEMVKSALNEEQLKSCFVDGAPRQGLPTSPSVANIAGSAIDKAIIRWRDKNHKQIIYTRYADDLSLSCDNMETVDAILKTVPNLIKQCGFKLAVHKTKVLSAKSGRRIICGVGVDATGVFPTREVKRRLRAAKHQKKESQIRGLTEWCALKFPRERQSTSKFDSTDSLKALSKVWRIKFPTSMPEKHSSDQQENDLLITGDPVYIAGMSTWTPGWKTCMHHPTGQYRKGVITWMRLKGTRIAMIQGKEKTVAGVTRKVMICRALIHTLRNDRVVFDRFYGDKNRFPEFEQRLRAMGIVNIREINGIRVVGNVAAKNKPYCDSLKTIKATIDGKSGWTFST